MSEQQGLSFAERVRLRKQRLHDAFRSSAYTGVSQLYRTVSPALEAASGEPFIVEKQYQLGEKTVVERYAGIAEEEKVVRLRDEEQPVQIQSHEFYLCHETGDAWHVEQGSIPFTREDIAMYADGGPPTFEVTVFTGEETVQEEGFETVLDILERHRSTGNGDDFHGHD